MVSIKYVEFDKITRAGLNSDKLRLVIYVWVTKSKKNESLVLINDVAAVS